MINREIRLVRFPACSTARSGHLAGAYFVKPDQNTPSPRLLCSSVPDQIFAARRGVWATSLDAGEGHLLAHEKRICTR